MRTVGACGCSIWCCRSGVRSVKRLDERCATHVADRSRDSCRLSASGVVRPARGPCVAVPSAREGGSRSPRRARRSCTTRVPARSFVRGRNAGGVGSRVTPPRSLRAWSRARRSTASCPFPATRNGRGSAATSPREASRASSGRSGTLPSSTSSSAVAHCRRQRGLSLDERRRNVRGSVSARSEVAPRVCVVDDVYTSGATVDACASACRRAGASHVEVITFARAVR